MTTKIPGESFTLALKQKLEFQGVELTWTSMVIETVVNPDGTNGEQNVTLNFLILEGTGSSEWSLMLPSNYQDYINNHPLECTFRSLHLFFRVIEVNLESFNAPSVKIVCTKH
jgi:hypothetical protein